MKVRADTAGVERRARRLKLLMQLLRGENIIVLATPAAVANKDFSRADFSTNHIRLELNKNLRLEDLINRLIDFDYERTDEIDTAGKFSVRGGIVDIFPINSVAPFRVEFFDTQIESIRELDAETLRSKRNFKSLIILPVKSVENKKAEPFLPAWVKKVR